MNILIPPPPSKKPVAFYDTECFHNYWLLKFRPQGGEVISFSLGAGERLSSSDASKIAQLFGMFTTVSFNGIYYDVPMLTAALQGFTTEQLKQLNDKIIPESGIGGLKPWELGLPEWKPSDHIDIMETLPGSGSLKEYAGRIHYRTMRDLPFKPDEYLTPEQMTVLAEYCENDLGQLEAEFQALEDQLKIREEMGNKYGVDLRSKSDAQCAEAILKRRCEEVLGRRIYKAEVDWNLKFYYEPPAFLRFLTPQMQNAFALVKAAIFTLGPSGAVVMPEQLEGLTIGIGSSVYRMGIGGLHTSEKSRVVRSTATHILRDADVASYYPSLMLNSGKYPLALGPAFISEFKQIKESRLEDKALQKKIENSYKYSPYVQGSDLSKKAVQSYFNDPEWRLAYSANEGKKVFVNGTFGKTLSFYSVLFAPQMGIQTTVTGQLSLLMAVEWLEAAGIPVVSANTDGVVINCPRHLVDLADSILKEWERVTGLELDWPLGEYSAIYSRDINAYFAVKSSGEVKRKGSYSEAGLVAKKSPDVEICGDAVAEFLSKGTPMLYTIAACRDIRKFVKVRAVAGGGVKLWGEGPRKDALVRDMIPVLLANGWVKAGRKWTKGELLTDATTAYKMCFGRQRPEYLGKVIRWYYGSASPGPIIYNSNGNTVGLSYGAQPCMTLPDEFPGDIDYAWYLSNCEEILKDVGYYTGL